jgi:hypothetical protein
MLPELGVEVVFLPDDLSGNSVADSVPPLLADPIDWQQCPSGRHTRYRDAGSRLADLVTQAVEAGKGAQS